MNVRRSRPGGWPFLLAGALVTASGCGGAREAEAEAEMPAAPAILFDETSEDTAAARMAAEGEAARTLHPDAPSHAPRAGTLRQTGEGVPVTAEADGAGSTSPVADSPAVRSQAVAAFAGGRIPVRCAPAFPLQDAFGTELYASTSHVCTAAVHAGAITHASGGVVEIEILSGQEHYGGSERHGVMTLEHGRAPRSFRVHGAPPVDR